MGKIIKLLFIAAVAYGVYWAVTNVDFANFFSDTTNKIKNEKTINRVNGSRQQIHDETEGVNHYE